MFFMAACEEALDPENKKFSWQSGQTRGDIKENSCWCMSFDAYWLDACTYTYIKIHATKQIF
jgi:hypothetical protein